MITAKEVKKRTAISIKEWEKRHEATLKIIEEAILERADDGYDDYICLCTDNADRKKLCGILATHGFNVYATPFGDGLKISWE